MHPKSENILPSKGSTFTKPDQQSPARKVIGDFAPNCFSDRRRPYSATCGPGLSPRDPSLINVSALANGSTEQLPGHLALAKVNGLNETELKEAILPPAFHKGWSRAISAITIAKSAFQE
jgi:4-carboxymuconolactone decarboxylase